MFCINFGTEDFKDIQLCLSVHSSPFLQFIFVQAAHKIVTMPRCPAAMDDSCERILKIRHYKGKNFKQDLECVKLEARRLMLNYHACSKSKKSSIQYDMVKRKMRARGWAIFSPGPDNVMGFACTPMWLPISHVKMYRRIERNPDESLGQESD